jgi:hypothetical protein
MKRLQNNFTTVEQSKRLLELGVPVDSSDCYYLHEHDDRVYLFQNQKESDNCISKIRLRLGLGHAMPCWSVGRLIEIYHICVGPGCSFTFHVCFQNLMNEVIYKLGEAKRNGWLELSRLEERV